MRQSKEYKRLRDGRNSCEKNNVHNSVESDKESTCNRWGVEVKTIDEVMEEIGVGKFQYFVFLICGISFMADAVEVSLLSFLAECLEVEWDLTEVQKSSLTSVVFVGQLFGSYIWGPFADMKGRKVAYISALATIVLAGYASAFARDFVTLAITRYFVGFGVGAIHIPFDIMAEFLPSRLRGNFLLGIQTFWSLGNIVVTLWAWLVLSPYGWRVMAFGCAVPMNISLIGAFYMPESPRWLMSQGRVEDAKRSLVYAAKMNNAVISDFQLPETQVEEEGSFLDLFSTRYLKLNGLVWTVWFCYGFVYYGIILFTTRLYARNDDDDGEDDKSCSFDYLHLFISAFVEFIALFFVLIGMNSMARNIFQSIFYGVSAMFCLIFAFFDTSTLLITLLSSVIRLAVRGGLTVTWIATPELYPTRIRSSGHAIASSMVRLAGVLCPFLASNDSISVAVVCFVLFVISSGASTASYFTPDSRFFDLDLSNDQNIERASVTSECGDAIVKSARCSQRKRPSWESLLHVDSAST